MTTYGTLTSVGESFFTSILSGRHKNPTDETGALFIDSEPFNHFLTKFRPIVFSNFSRVSQIFWSVASFLAQWYA